MEKNQERLPKRIINFTYPLTNRAYPDTNRATYEIRFMKTQLNLNLNCLCYGVRR